MKYLYPLAITSLLLQVNCSFITTGPEQVLTISTPEVEGAHCALTDEKGGKWYLSSTPGTVTVLKGNGPISLICNKDGYKPSVSLIEERKSPTVYFNTMTGVLPAMVDAASGVSERYPNHIVVWMEPRVWSSPIEKQQWAEEKLRYEREIYQQKHHCRFSHLTNC